MDEGLDLLARVVNVGRGRSGAEDVQDEPIRVQTSGSFSREERWRGSLSTRLNDHEFKLTITWITRIG